MNLVDPLRRHARRAPDHPALRFEGEKLSYAALEARARTLARGLRAHGVQPGDRIAIFLPNVPDFVAVYYAIQWVGAMAVSINAMFKSAELVALLNDAQAIWVFTAAELVAQVPETECPALRGAVICDAPLGADLPAPAVALADWLAAVPSDVPEADPTDCAADAPACLLYSSGTTGSPKGVILTQHNVASNIATAAEASGYRPEDRLALFLPLFHVYAQNHILNAAISVGATLVLFRRFVPETVLDAIERERITMFFGVPTISIALLGMDLSGRDLSSLRYEMSAASTLPEEVARRWTEHFGRCIYEGYGLTECSPFAAYNDAVAHRPGSVGRAVRDVRIEIHDAQGRELPRGAWGEIVIRGPGVMAGYWRRPQETAEALRDGWLHSGDIGRMDEEGYVFIVDRVKDMINVAGFKVWPAELEQYLYRLPGVHECAVYGVPDPVKGEQVAVAVVAVPGSGLTAAALIDWCRAHLAAYKVPTRVELVHELPKSATGKLLKRVLRSRAVEQGAST